MQRIIIAFFQLGDDGVALAPFRFPCFGRWQERSSDDGVDRLLMDMAGRAIVVEGDFILADGS